MGHVFKKSEKRYLEVRRRTANTNSSNTIRAKKSVKVMEELIKKDKQNGAKNNTAK